jgi:hypothetical protein
VTEELEALKQRLISLRPDDLPEVEAHAIAAEISAIRLQLKRIAADRDSAEQSMRPGGFEPPTSRSGGERSIP